jgi:hypothetical protein
LQHRATKKNSPDFRRTCDVVNGWLSLNVIERLTRYAKQFGSPSSTDQLLKAGLRSPFFTLLSIVAIIDWHSPGSQYSADAA